MRNRNDDIVKYRKGELSAQEMHALEKEALRDPFLADALEGVDSIDAHHLENDLKELNRRFVKSKNKNLIWTLRIAASIIMIIGAYWLVNEFSEQTAPESLVMKKPEQVMSADSIKSSAETESKITSEETQMPASGDESKDKSEPKALKQEEKQSGPVMDMILSESQKVASGGTGKTIPESVKADEIKNETAPVVSAEKEVAEEQPVEATKLSQAQPQKSEALRMKRATTAEPPSTIISGRVTSLEDGSPIPGVNVVVKGTTLGAVTNLNGEYQIKSPEVNPQLAFSFIGFQTKEVRAAQSTVNVQLNYDAAQLSEVVVTGYKIGDADDQHEPVVKLAEPFGGIKAYDNYLKTSLRYPKEALEKKIKGRVTVQFTVKTDGSLDSFNIMKGLGYGCDDEVIRLVKEGPKWSPTTEDNVPVESEVRVKVRFTLPN